MRSKTKTLACVLAFLSVTHSLCECPPPDGRCRLGCHKVCGLCLVQVTSGVLLPRVVQFPVAGRGDAHPLAELFDEIALVAEAGFVGDVGAAHIALLQQALRLLNAQLMHMLQDGFSSLLFYQMRDAESA